MAPIYLRLVVKGKRVEYCISRRVNPMFWSATSEKVMGNNREAKEINDHMANLRHKLNKVHQTFIDNDIEVTDIR